MEAGAGGLRARAAAQAAVAVAALVLFSQTCNVAPAIVLCVFSPETPGRVKITFAAIS